MSSKFSDETASASANWTWRICIFILGAFFGAFIPRIWKSSLKKFRALLGHLLTSSQSSSVYRYEVFLSFRGVDTRNTFVDHLYKHLTEKGIFTFKDDERLETGGPIPLQLMEAIRDSRAAIVVFSSHYADSRWCLEEMAAIADRHRESKQIVIPIFYYVDTSDVRRQRGAYRNPFVSLEKRYRRDRGKVQRWKKAMTYLANLSGHDVTDKPETTEIEKIIQDVTDKLGHKFSADINDVIGIQPHVEELERLLKLNSEDDDFRILGISGMGGIGKTLHAMALFNKISYHFNACCFIKDVSQIHKDHHENGDIEVLKMILHQTVQEKNLEMRNPIEITGILQRRLCNKMVPRKVLIVLDNVNDPKQWRALAIDPKSLGRGSRVIITSRNEDILSEADEIYKVPLLNDDDALDLFLIKAFRKGRPRPIIISDAVLKILEHVQNLPLAIEELGYESPEAEEERSNYVLQNWRKHPSKKVMKVLRRSYDVGLTPDEQKIFLDVACFFGGKRKEYVEHILDSCGISDPQNAIQQIGKKSLITIRNQEIHMHKMLQELGKKIVKGSHLDEPQYWTRLWHVKDFEHVLMSYMETNDVQAIVLDQKDNCSHLWIEGLSKMRGLKLLMLYHENFSGNLNSLSNNLRYLLWHGYPFSSLPLFEPYSRLVELNMLDSSIKHLWKGHKVILGTQRNPYLERVDLSNSKDLMETPNFEWSPRIKWLDFSGCTNLSQVHPSIGLLTQLTYLSLRNCSNLVNLNLGTECKLSSLRVLYLCGCTRLENTPNFSGLSNLEHLDLERCTSLKRLHWSIWTHAMLKFLSLRHCTSLVDEIPYNINSMASLQTLDLHGCLKPRNLPLGPGFESLIFLDLGFCTLREIPDAIGGLSCLERLNLQRNRIRSLPHTLKRLSRLAYLNLAHCRMLESMPALPFDSASSGGSYLKTVSTSHNHRSGLYIFNCSMAMKSHLMLVALSWIARLVEQQPCHFRCGFDIVIPVNSPEFPEWYFNHQFKGGSIIRIVGSDLNDNWLGFAFCVTFHVNDNLPAISDSSSQLPCPLYLSFESKHAEECFATPLCLDMDKLGRASKYYWIIYISWTHCHFVKIGASITFKAHQRLTVEKWGLRMVFKQDIEATKRELHDVGNHGDGPRFHSCMDETSEPKFQLSDYRLVTKEVHESSSSTRPKTQRPYDWLVNGY